MIGLVMAGGKGSRMHLNTEKLLLKYKKPIVLHVIDALKNSQCFEKIIAVTSSNAPKTEQLLLKYGITIIKASGEGYVEDLNYALNIFSDKVFVVSGDMPLLDGITIKEIISKYNSDHDWISIVVTKDFINSLGFSTQFSIRYQNKQCLYTGISLVNSRRINSLNTITEHIEIINEKKIAFNLNTSQDYKLLNTV